MRNAYFLRLDRGESIADVAAATGVHPDTISAIERGESQRPRGATVRALAVHYKVGAREIFEPVVQTNLVGEGIASEPRYGKGSLHGLSPDAPSPAENAVEKDAA